MVVVLSPSWPTKLEPQHLRSVPAVTTFAHVCMLPSASSPTAPPTLIVVGVLRVIFVPSPGWMTKGLVILRLRFVPSPS